jgi:hypothetical protein
MAFVHTPNHYKTVWRFLKKSSLVVILGIGFLLNQFPLEITKSMMIDTNNMAIIAKALVISHVIYQEYYFHRKSPVQSPKAYYFDFFK